MNLSLIRSMTRSAVFELENGKCFRPEHPFTVALNGKTIYESCNINVFSLFSLTPSTSYTVEVDAEGEHLKLDFTTEAESFFVDASRYGLVADGETDNTGKLQAALSTCPKGGTVYVPAGRYRTASLFLKSNTTLYLEKGAVLLGDNDRTHYPILPGVLPSENEVDEYYLTGWEGNPLDSFAGLLNITQVHDVVVTGEGTLDCDAENGDWWVTPKIKRIAWRPRAVAAVDSENICLHGITVQNSYSWTIHPIFVKHLDLLNFNINNPYNAPNTDGIDPESCEYIRIIGVNIHVGDDCIAMKASKVFLGMKLKKSCEHTVIRNCLLDKGHGGIVIGSEMSGGVKDMVVTQCLMDHTDRGLRVKTRRGRGNTAVIDGLVFRNVEMRGVKAPFVINMFYFCDPDGHGPYVQCRDAMPVDEYTPKLGSLTMEDIVATDAQFAGCYFDGLPEQPIERVSMKNVTITFDPNAEAGQAAMADNRPLVKKLAIYAENVKSIQLHNVKIEGYEDLLNPALKGKIATADPANSSSAFAHLTNMLLAMGGYEDDKAWQYVHDLFENVDGKICESSSGVYKGVADGEYVVGLSYEDPCAQLVLDGAPVKIVYMKEGTVFLPASATIIKGAKNMDNAKLFIDFILSEEVQNIWGSTLTNRPVMKDAATNDAMTPMADINVIEEDIPYVSAHKSELVDKYTEIITDLQSK